jgi:hypothetical protein
MYHLLENVSPNTYVPPPPLELGKKPVNVIGEKNMKRRKRKRGKGERKKKKEDTEREN